MQRVFSLIFAATFLLAALIVEPASAGVNTENTWATKAPMHQDRFNLGVAVVDGKIYAMGGQVNVQFDITGVNEEYDPRLILAPRKHPCQRQGPNSL